MKNPRERELMTDRDAALDRIADALELLVPMFERMVDASEQSAIILERASLANELADECAHCNDGKILALPKAGEMPVLMICGYCRGSGKSDG